MKGSITISERKEILNKASGIVFVSRFLKEKFLHGINLESSKLHVLPNSLSINKKSLSNKDSNVLFVGRIVKERV